MTISIKRIETAEEAFETLNPIRMYSFWETPPLPKLSDEDREDRLRYFSVTRHLALYEDDTVMAASSAVDMTQNVRGEIYPMTGLWGVCSMPQARRKGYIRQVMQVLLQQEREAGYVFGGLYPFKESFYERLGYITFPKIKQVTFSPSALVPLMKLDIPGEVDLMIARAGYDDWRRFCYSLQPTTHGMAEPNVHESLLWTRYNDERWLALVREQGEIRGAMLYQIKDEGDDDETFFISEYSYAVDAVARYRLLEWVARHADQADKARLQLHPAEQPEMWLADVDLKIEGHRPGMGRVLDVEKIGGMEVGIGGFVATILDPLCPWNAGTFEFKAVNGRLQVAKTDKPGCVLTIQGLSALVFGTQPPEAFTIKGWGNPTKDIQTAMRALFPPQMPYMHTRY